jgi:Zn-dependent M28 family amino/carboxypeptidase
MGYPMEVRDRFTSASDHFPFAMHGVPTGSVSTTELSASAVQGLVGRGWGHTAADTFDKVNGKSLQAAAMVAARVLLHVAEAGDWPARHKTTAEVEQQLAQSGMLDTLKRAGRWPPPR